MKLAAIRVIVALLLCVGLSAATAKQVALEPGARIPAFQLRDQAGQLQTFESLKGPNGLLLILSRSADWCPLCKSQLIDFETARVNFEAKGVRVASVTYDSAEILRTFAERKKIGFELLSDPDSKTIDAFGVRNLEATGTQAGIAIPNYYLVGPDGVIRNRWEEDTLENRVTANYFYETVFGFGTASPALTTKEPVVTPHVSVTLTQSDAHSAPGARVKLTIILDPAKGTHVYAPGAEVNGYHAVNLTLGQSDLFSSTAAVYPASKTLDFPALHERVPVFESKTIVTQDVTAVRSPQTNASFAAHPELVIHGTPEYQACTDTVCFPPQKVPVQWSLKVRAEDLDQVRVPEALQRK